MQVNCTFCRMKNVCMSSWLTHCIGTLAFVQFITKSLCKLNLRIWIHLGVHNCKNTICRKFQICNNWQICNLEQIAELQTCKFAGHKLDLQKNQFYFKPADGNICKIAICQKHSRMCIQTQVSVQAKPFSCIVQNVHTCNLHRLHERFLWTQFSQFSSSLIGANIIR